SFQACNLDFRWPSLLQPIPRHRFSLSIVHSQGAILLCRRDALRAYAVVPGPDAFKSGSAFEGDRRRLQLSGQFTMHLLRIALFQVVARFDLSNDTQQFSERHDFIPIGCEREPIGGDSARWLRHPRAPLFKIVDSVTPSRSFSFLFRSFFVSVDVYPHPSAQDFSSVKTACN